MNSVMSVQQKNKLADGPRFLPHYNEAPFIIGQLHDDVILLHNYQNPLVCCFLVQIKAIVP